MRMWSPDYKHALASSGPTVWVDPPLTRGRWVDPTPCRQAKLGQDPKHQTSHWRHGPKWKMCENKCVTACITGQHNNEETTMWSSTLKNQQIIKAVNKFPVTQHNGNLISLNIAMKAVHCTLRERSFIEEPCWPEMLFPFYSLQIRDCEDPYIPVSILMRHCTFIMVHNTHRISDCSTDSPWLVYC